MMKWESSKSSTRGEGIDFFNTFPNFYKIGLFILVLILFINIIPVKVLLAKDFRTNEYLKSWTMGDGDNFTVLYTHSVQLCPVSETYVIRDKEIILKETYFETFGAGLPSTTPYNFEITNTGFRIYDINELMENLIYRTGAERADHVLIYKDKEYRFLEFSKPRTGVEFKVSNISLLTYLVKEVLQ